MGLNMDLIRRRKEELDSRGEDYNYWRPKEGKNNIRIMPQKEGKELFWSEGYVHFSVGPKKNMVTCLETFGKPCPICEEVEKLKNSGYKEDKQLAKDMKQTQRIYMNIIDRDSEDDEEQIQVMTCGTMILSDILDMICDPDWGNITDYTTGRDIVITRTGKGMQTKYSVLGKPKQTIASETLSEEEIQKKLVDLDSIFIEKSYDELKDLLLGMEGSSEYNDDNDEGVEEDEETNYDELSLKQLKCICEELGVPIPKNPTKLKLITLLEAYDSDDFEEDDFEEDEEDEDEDEEDSTEDELRNEIQDALKKRKKK